MTKKKHRTLQLVASILSNRISRFAGYFFHIRDRTVRHDRDVVNRQQKVYIGRFFPKESKVQVSSSHCLSRPMAPPPFYLYCNKRQGKKRWKNDLLRLLLSLQIIATSGQGNTDGSHIPSGNQTSPDTCALPYSRSHRWCASAGHTHISAVCHRDGYFL